MRVFYVIYIPNEQLRTCIDAIRLLSNPAEKESAHVTVRGPYKQRYNVRNLSSSVQGAPVAIVDASCFFEDQQNTVYFRCQSSQLQKVWCKPHYPQFNPHITIYDGASRRFASRLAHIVNRYHYRLCFRAEGLCPLVSVKGQNNMNLHCSYDAAFLAKVLGEPIEREQFFLLEEPRRLELIDRICSYLSSLRYDIRTCELEIDAASSNTSDAKRKSKSGDHPEGRLRRKGGSSFAASAGVDALQVAGSKAE